MKQKYPPTSKGEEKCCFNYALKNVHHWDRQDVGQLELWPKAQQLDAVKEHFRKSLDHLSLKGHR